MLEDAPNDTPPQEASPVRQSYWDLPPAKADRRAWLKRATIAVVVAGVAVRLWPVVRDFNAEEEAVESFLADAPVDSGAVVDTWLKIAVDGSGRELVISFVGRPERTSDGRCATAYTTGVQESESEVRVSIIASTSLADGTGSVVECGSDVETRTAVVTLETPLRGRDVINEATGRAEPVGSEG